MDDDLPTEFDIIVLGTGLTESIVAAAASRIGKTVLHLDSNDYYGGFWASYNLESLHRYAEECREPKPQEALEVRPNFVPLKRGTLVENVSEGWFNFEERGNVDGWNREMIIKEFRRFNVDLAPKLLYSRGDMVELLISSNICRYAEFRAVDRVATIWNERILTVPCSRSDVFTSRDVNVVEKRLLMKFLQSCASWDEKGSEGDSDHKPEDLEGKTFLEYLKTHKLTPNLIHYLLYTIAMGNDRTSCREGLEGVKKFLLSLGRYGNSPFLFPMYGCGEVPQCFCRLCAVFGGIYCLGKPIEGINLHSGESSFQSLMCGNQTIRAKELVIGHGYVSAEDVFTKTGSESEPQAQRKACGRMARGVFLTNVPLGGASQNMGGGGVALMKLPPVEGHEDGATVLQLAHFSGTVPKNIYLIHVTARAIGNDPKADLEPYVTQILYPEAPACAISKPPAEQQPPQSVPDTENVVVESTEENNTSTILYELYFNIPTCTGCQERETKPGSALPKGIHLSCGPLHELDYDESISRAKEIFKKIYPDDEFLPRAPDPEEIIIGDETEEAKEQSDVITGDPVAEDGKVESGSECQEDNSGTPGTISDAQEAQEDPATVESAAECVEQQK
ncbi:rab proteins geranylgeranyltransferase component A [Uranotaenia lowii]|uniref:rab proteins geranylgeranyltransferase component A n=1 Tax=Uranotaenia lowii TaxID=190385 RepID=UPI002479CD53|nr:rab proteins geranylgeranyltransferase component A [Uranotaenia lowii]